MGQVLYGKKGASRQAGSQPPNTQCGSQKSQTGMDFGELEKSEQIEHDRYLALSVMHCEV